jgi:broad specificity phosphatase PhoE
VSTTIFLVRHAAHDRLGRVLCGRMPGIELSEFGRAQAAAVAARLAPERLAAVYASPLERACQTGAVIAEQASLPLLQDGDLDEIDLGAWSGKPFEALAADPAWDLWNRARGLARAPGGESMIDVQARAGRWMQRALVRHPEVCIAAVSHADVIKGLLAQVLGASPDHHDRLEIAPASVSIVTAGDWGAKVLLVNEAPR